jgi:hypothetical protein
LLDRLEVLGDSGGNVAALHIFFGEAQSLILLVHQAFSLIAGSVEAEVRGFSIILASEGES